ncbi:MAG: histidine kinase, partial [Verrucomicrobia bacterium]|nr:histidine kinase [Verrucomicrobiota bacterium]
LSDDVVLCLHVDGDGALWIGTANGLNRLKDGRLSVFTTGNGLADNTVNQILEDDFGCFWLGSNRGIARIKRSELNDVAEGRRRAADHLTVGEADGMASGETSGEQQPAGVKARDGRLWFPTTRGVAVIDPRAFEVNAVVPPVVIERVLAEDEPVFGDGAAGVSAALRPGKALRFAPGRGRSLTFHFTANSLVDPSRVNFRFRLDGYDGAWKRPTGERFANYTNLKPGDYRFLVQACNNDGVWNQRTTALAFVVERRFHETLEFYAALALVLAAIVWGVHRMRVKALREIQQLEQFRALDAERTRIAQDMHDDLGASLTQIAVLSEVAQRDMANPQRTAAHVGRISTTARGVVDDIAEIIWAINPRNDRLDNLCAYLREYTGQFFDTSPIQCRLDFPDDVPALTVNAALRRNVFLVVKESLNNIVKHSGATQAEVRLRVRNTVNGAARLEMRVTDNGRGVNLESVSQFSNGLQNMRKRMEDLGGSFTLQPAPGSGTEVVFVVPLPVDPTAKPGEIAREI